MRGKWVIGIIGAFFILLVIAEATKEQPIDWEASFSRSDKIPYGTYLCRERLPDIFSDGEIEDVYEPIFVLMEDYFYENSAYIFIDQKFEIDEYDWEKLYSFIEEGNYVFISASSYSGALVDSLGLQFKEAHSLLQEGADSVVFSFTDDCLNPDSLYSSSDWKFFQSFENIDTFQGISLAENQYGDPIFVKKNIGDGALYLNTTPYYFSNYFFLEENHHDLVSKMLSYIPNTSYTMWDEYYKVGRLESQVLMRNIWNNEALYWGMMIVLSSVLFYMAFHAKRRQRVIPVVEPLANTTLKFVNTMGALYLQSSDHKDLANKKIIYFLDFLRRRYFIPKPSYNENFYHQLANKTGVEYTEVRKLFLIIKAIHPKTSISEGELMNLNNCIDAFYKVCKI